MAGGASRREVAEDVYAYVQHDGSWWINTTGFVVGPDDVLAIDSCATAVRAQRLRQTIAEVTTAPVRRLVNTHHHGDHTFGNAAFPGATVFAHHNCREAVLADQARHVAPHVWNPAPDWGELPLRPPDVTFTDRLTLHVAGKHVEIVHIGPRAHTTGDVVCWLPGQGVLFAGDLAFHGGTPMVLQGSLTGSLDALRQLRAFGASTVVPGHGEPCGPEIFDHHERYYRFVLAAARDGLDRGLSPLQTAANLDLGEFADLLDPERIVLNLHRAYADLTGHGEVDPKAAFADAIAYNGGRPLHCTA
ncbi:MBL fold metallo-hydrolase [Lentzea nigeriaca]|uniref:MBL fold metallo-hydrolase n=1 Tax=Lentzea nigeriaca TaxID=1128665 RepID=UPI00195BDD09|nr:MBL fold metallo-hydrolase [Lentzea nigeriaca]MBM7863626.1 cyclase [Lentzea nigeriaca]